MSRKLPKYVVGMGGMLAGICVCTVLTSKKIVRSQTSSMLQRVALQPYDPLQHLQPYGPCSPTYDPGFQLCSVQFSIWVQFLRAHNIRVPTAYLQVVGP